ncbi:hypothetical protein LI328DRAFT_160831 [Trichoderma asperelloides]|nr:hypothetical protein LI328DRAFT_160831 [Trichoderma asperelloides]
MLGLSYKLFVAGEPDWNLQVISHFPYLLKASTTVACLSPTASDQSSGFSGVCSAGAGIGCIPCIASADVLLFRGRSSAKQTTLVQRASRSFMILFDRHWRGFQSFGYFTASSLGLYRISCGLFYLVSTK